MSIACLAVVHNQRTDPNHQVLNRVMALCQKLAPAVVVTVYPVQHKHTPCNGVLANPTNTPDLVLVLGGDGTFLQATHLFAPCQVPMLGVNTGSLGFLTRVDVQQLDTLMAQLLTQPFALEHRLMLAVHNGHSHSSDAAQLALNDVVIKNANPSQLTALEILLDGNELARLDADGVIISTPTGSTAYNMAAGGPILSPALHALAITPVCPHSLSLKPLVVPATHTITIKALAKNFERTQRVQVSVDGQPLGELGEGEPLHITVAPHPLKLVSLGLPNDDFYALMRNKLHWGFNPRTTPKERAMPPVASV
jgi:NAD+ kinase